MRLLPYVNAFARWVDDYIPWAVATECRVYHRINGKAYAGTFDLLAEIEGKRVLVDLKTGAKAKWHAVQLAAYAMAYMTGNVWIEGKPVNPDKLAVLYLQADGKYKYDLIPGARFVEAIREFKGYL